MSRLVVIEDNVVNLRLICDVLAAAGHEVLHAADAIAGHALVARELPDAVLMDVGLPGVDGLEATRRLKADPALAGIPVIAVTAHAMKGDQERAIAAGCAAYVAKPIRYRELLKVVADVVG